MNNAYTLMQELLTKVPDKKAPQKAIERWISDFNAVAKELEENVQHDETEAADQITLPPWFARHGHDDTLRLYSPPLVYKDPKRGVLAARLIVDARHPISGEKHVNAWAIGVDSNFDIKGFAMNSCQIFNTNADQIKDSPLVAIWFLWDSIARIGIAKGLEHGLINPGWVVKVFDQVPDPQSCGSKYPHVYYKNGNASNEYLQTLYRLCEARGIKESDLHGSGWMEFNNKRGTDRTYRNSWINDDGVCKACKNKNKPLSYGHGGYPYGSVLGHVRSIRHRRNAAEYLLHMQQNKSVKAPRLHRK